jgi:hypothetical protein
MLPSWRKKIFLGLVWDAAAAAPVF